MINVDSSVVNVGLPVIGQRFSVSVSSLQWVVSIYLLTVTSLLTLAGKLSERYGRREIFLFGLMFFLLTSLLCALAPSYDFLIVGRLLQGLGAAFIQSNVMAITVMSFPSEEKGRVLGMIGSVVALGTLIGPALGGVLIFYLGWRSVFWLNIPFGLMGWLGAFMMIPRIVPQKETALDRLGASLFTLFIFTSLLAVDLLHTMLVLAAFLLGVGFLIIGWYVKRERSISHPFLPVSLFAIRGFVVAFVSGILFWIQLMIPLYVMPFYLRKVMHLPMWLIGAFLTAQALASILTSPYAGLLTDTKGILLPARLALVFMFLADAAIAFWSGHIAFWGMPLLLAILGLGTGFFSAPMNTLAMRAVPSEQTGNVSSLLALQRNVGRIFGVALSSLMLSFFLGNRTLKSASIAQFVSGERLVFLAGVAIVVVMAILMLRYTPKNMALPRSTSNQVSSGS